MQGLSDNTTETNTSVVFPTTPMNVAGAIWIRKNANENRLLRILLEGDFYTAFQIGDPCDYRIIQYDADEVPRAVGSCREIPTQQDQMKLTISMDSGQEYKAISREHVSGNAADLLIYYP